MVGFFTLKTAADLRGKLERDLARLKEDPLSVDAAFNFFVTAEHIADWAYPGDANQSRRTTIRKSTELLKLCSHLGNGAKHFELDPGRHKSVGSSEVVGNSGYFTGYFPAVFTRYFPGSGGRRLVVFLDAAAREFGPSIGAVELAEKVMEHWAAQDLPC